MSRVRPAPRGLSLSSPQLNVFSLDTPPLPRPLRLPAQQQPMGGGEGGGECGCRGERGASEGDGEVGHERRGGDCRCSGEVRQGGEKPPAASEAFQLHHSHFFLQSPSFA